MSDYPSDNGAPDFFDYTDNALTGSISQAIRRNDKDLLLKMLKKRKINPLPVPADNRNWTVLHVAASRSEYKDCLELLLKYRDSILIDLNAQTFLRETALFIACKNGCEESVEILLQNGCDPYKITFEYETPLHAAVTKGNLKIVETLLNYRENIQHPNSETFTPLHLSALHGHLEITRVLLDKGGYVRSKDGNFHLPLHLALQNNYFDIVRLLLKPDLTTINCPNKAGITPLMLAVENCNVEDVRFLIENGAKTDACDKKGRMPLHFAAYRGNVEILQLVLQSTDTSSVEQCISNIPNVWQAEETIYSLICCAIHSENVECLNILLSSELPKNVLEMPHVERESGSCLVYSPVAYLFKTIFASIDEPLNSCLQLLLKHKIMNFGFTRAFRINWPRYVTSFIHPFSHITDLPLLRQQHYLNLLSANDITTDYCLQCYHDNKQPFATFIDYRPYYSSILKAIYLNKVETVKCMLYNSVILEPDELKVQYKRYLSAMRSGSRFCPVIPVLGRQKKPREVLQYLTSLKPVYFKQFPHVSYYYQTDRSLCSYSTIQEEFSKSSLKQLCRSVIRQHLREYTLEDNLRNFKRKIMELPLPPSLKDYLLFRN